MHSRADEYRRRAMEAKLRAAQTTEYAIKATFRDIARNWLMLAEQVEWMEHHGLHSRSSRQEEV